MPLVLIFVCFEADTMAVYSKYILWKQPKTESDWIILINEEKKIKTFLVNFVYSVKKHSIYCASI